MGSPHASMETHRPESTPSLSPCGSDPSPRYTPSMWVGRPRRLHFRMIDEPDAAAIAYNSNGWVIEEDEEYETHGLWSPQTIKRWAETTTDLSTPTQVNDVLYGFQQITLPRQMKGRDDDDRTGYLMFEDDDDDDFHHFYSDVDTMTGSFLPPLKHPKTLPAPMHPMDDTEPGHRQRTSEDIIENNVSGQKNGKESKSSSPQRAYQDAILAVEEDLCRKPIKRIEGHLFSVPKALTFRPAASNDMEAITTIYNEEVMGAGMAPDSAPVPVETFHSILRVCQRTSKPFIVGVRNANPLADISNWPDRMAFEDWLRLKKAQGEPVEAEEEVVGFAYLGAFDFGIWVEGNAPHSARIRCFVGPSDRRHGIGRALVDLMLQMTVTGYTAKCDANWKRQKESTVFNLTAFENTKKYHRLFIEVYFKNKGDRSFQGLRVLLENELGFTPMGRILGGYKTERGEDSIWLDKHIWGMDAVHKDEVGWYQRDVRVQ